MMLQYLLRKSHRLDFPILLQSIVNVSYSYELDALFASIRLGPRRVNCMVPLESFLFGERAADVAQRARLGVAGHLSTTLRWKNSVEVPIQTAQQVNLPACFPHCPFNAKCRGAKR